MTVSRTIILASASPRRKELLAKLGLKFKVEASDYQEEIPDTLNPHQLARFLSRGKARAVARKHRHALVIAADTFGVFQGKILGKPDTEAEAKEILETISGKMHVVITGFTIIDTDTKKTLSRSVATKVYFRKLTAAEIEAYVKSKEPRDKAGAYAIQELGAVLVKRIEGDYYNVIGLPLSALTESLKKFGICVLPSPAELDRSQKTQ